LPLEWILSAIGNIVISEDDDLVFWDLVVYQDLVGMADISLMSVVPESIGSCNEDSPMVLGSSHGQT